MRIEVVDDDETKKYVQLLWNEPDVQIKRKAAINIAKNIIRRIMQDLDLTDEDMHFIHIMRDAIVFIYASWVVSPYARNSILYHHRYTEGDKPYTKIRDEKIDHIHNDDILIFTDSVICSGGTQKAVFESFLEIIRQRRKDINIEKLLKNSIVAVIATTDRGIDVLDKIGIGYLYYAHKSGISEDGKTLKPQIFPIWDFGDNIYLTTVDTGDIYK